MVEVHVPRSRATGPHRQINSIETQEKRDAKDHVKKKRKMKIYK